VKRLVKNYPALELPPEAVQSAFDILGPLPPQDDLALAYALAQHARFVASAVSDIDKSAPRGIGQISPRHNSRPAATPPVSRGVPGYCRVESLIDMRSERSFADSSTPSGS
jgi:hypothetical protein